jgi:hypothetical protein
VARLREVPVMTDTARTTRPIPKDVVLRLEAEIVPGIPLQDDVREGRGASGRFEDDGLHASALL